MQIYTSYGYTRRDAAKSILEKNLYGIDIDTRAYQLAYFAVMMKARQYNRRIFKEGKITTQQFKKRRSCSPFLYFCGALIRAAGALPQKIGSDGFSSRGRLQPSRKTERDLLRRGGENPEKQEATFCKIEIPTE